VTPPLTPEARVRALLDEKIDVPLEHIYRGHGAAAYRAGYRAAVTHAAALLADAQAEAEPQGLVDLVRRIQTTVATESAKGINWSHAQQTLFDELLAYQLPEPPR
jgi:hypothetical protein